MRNAKLEIEHVLTIHQNQTVVIITVSLKRQRTRENIVITESVKFTCFYSDYRKKKPPRFIGSHNNIFFIFIVSVESLNVL